MSNCTRGPNSKIEFSKLNVSSDSGFILAVLQITLFLLQMRHGFSKSETKNLATDFVAWDQMFVNETMATIELPPNKKYFKQGFLVISRAFPTGFESKLSIHEFLVTGSKKIK